MLGFTASAGSVSLRIRSDSISPTAHLTGYVWHRQGWSHPALVTPTGRLMYLGLRPAMLTSSALGGPALEDLLVARHRAIDQRLAEAIEAGTIGQVIEVAAGLSPRGWDFSRRYGPRLRYIEADLPSMAEIKRRRLLHAHALAPGHEIVGLDALAEQGPQSLAALAARLDPGVGTAIVTEGLLNYFDEAAVRGMWRRFAAALGGFRAGLYLSDLHLEQENRGVLARRFVGLLSAFVRGRVHLHFDTVERGAQALRSSGFRKAVLHRPEALVALGRPGSGGGAGVRIIEAWR